MRRSLWTSSVMIALVALCVLATPATAAPPDGLLDSVVAQGRKDGWKWPYVGIDVGGTRYVCRMDNGKVLSQSKSPHVAGVIDGWAAVGVVPLDAKKHEAAQGAGWLLQRSGKTWQLKALDEGVGYSRAALDKAHIPAATVKKLGLQIAE